MDKKRPLLDGNTKRGLTLELKLRFMSFSFGNTNAYMHTYNTSM